MYALRLAWPRVTPNALGAAARQAMSATAWRRPARRRPECRWSKTMLNRRSFAGRLYAVVMRPQDCLPELLIHTIGS